MDSEALPERGPPQRTQSQTALDSKLAALGYELSPLVTAEFSLGERKKMQKHIEAFFDLISVGMPSLLPICR